MRVIVLFVLNLIIGFSCEFLFAQEVVAPQGESAFIQGGFRDHRLDTKNERVLHRLQRKCGSFQQFTGEIFGSQPFKRLVGIESLYATIGEYRKISQQFTEQFSAAGVATVEKEFNESLKTQVVSDFSKSVQKLNSKFIELFDKLPEKTRFEVCRELCAYGHQYSLSNPVVAHYFGLSIAASEKVESVEIEFRDREYKEIGIPKSFPPPPLSDEVYFGLKRGHFRAMKPLRVEQLEVFLPMVGEMKVGETIKQWRDRQHPKNQKLIDEELPQLKE